MRPSAHDCVEDTSCAKGGDETIDVRFNSRSYLLAPNTDGADSASTCASTSFGSGDYSCVDYNGGAYKLAGKELSFTIDVSNAGCGCNAAVYLVSMPQNTDPTICKDHYCDANVVCGVACAEIDSIEANKAALVTTPHVADDPNGEGFGIAHYVGPKEKRLTSDRGDDCPYGPRESCTIDTNRPFTARFRFSSSSSDFEYSLVLEQEGGRRASIPSPIKYLNKPGKGSVSSAEQANQMLRTHLDAGMTLVVSYWAGRRPREMAWLDQPCTGAEVGAWHCKDEWNDPPWHSGWPWTCDKMTGDHGGTNKPDCSKSFTISNIQIGSGRPSASTYAAGGVAAAGLAGLAYVYNKRRGGRLARGRGRCSFGVCGRPMAGCHGQRPRGEEQRRVVG